MKKTILFFLVFIKLNLYSSNVQLKEPINNACYSNEDINLIKFKWEATTNSAYQLEVAIDTNFTSPTLYTTNATNIDIDITSLLLGKYFWRVRSTNDTSKIRTFNIIDLTQVGNLTYRIDASKNIDQNNNNNVTLWGNLVDPFYNLSQNTTTNMPLFVENGINNKDVVKFGGEFGINKSKLSQNTFEIADTNFTIILAYKQISINSALSYVLGGSSPIGGVYSGGTYAGGINFGIYDGTNIHRSTGITNLDWGVRTASYSKKYLNTVSQSTVGNNNASLRFNTVGLRPDILTLNFHGYLGDVLIYDEILSDSTRMLVENYIRTKYTPYPDLGKDTIVCKDEFKIGLRADNGYSKIDWSTGESDVDSVLVTNSGTYWVTVESFGISLTDTIKIELSEKPELNLLNDTNLCFNDGSFLTYESLGPYIYEWSNTSTADTLFNLGTQSYFISQTDTNRNCTINSNEIKIFMDSFSIKTSLGPDRVFCLGSELNINTSQKNNEPYDYYWSTGDSTETTLLSLTNDTIIYVETIDAIGCVFKDTILAQVNSTTIPIVNFISDTVCLGAESYLQSISIASGADVINNYIWSFPDFNTTSNGITTSFSNSNAVGFTVELTIETDSSCKNSITLPVYNHNLPQVNFTDVLVCKNDSVIINNTSYASLPDAINLNSWFFNQNFESNSNSPKITFTNEGISEVKLIVKTNLGCKDSITKQIEVFPEFKADFSFRNNCIGDSVSFIDETQSLSIVDWNWTFNSLGSSIDQNPKYQFLNIGNQIVSMEIENAIGCISKIAKNVIVNPIPLVSFGFDKICVGDSTLFYGQTFTPSDSVKSYYWEIDTSEYHLDSIDHFFDSESLIDIKLEIETHQGCKNDTIASVTVYPKPVPQFDFNPNYGVAPLVVDFENLTPGNNGYLWKFDNNEFSNEENPTHTFTENGVYNLTLSATNEFNCNQSIIKNLSVIPSDLDVELKNIELEIKEGLNNTFSIKPTIQINNVGTRNIENMDLVLRLNTENQFAQKWIGNLNLGEKMSYIFDSYFLVSNLDLTNYVCVEAINVNDNTELNFQNNKVCKNLKGLIQFSKPYPNPANDQIYIDVITNNEGNCKIQIIEISGKSVYQNKSLELLEGYNQLEIETINYQSGKYIMRIEYLDEEYIYSFVVR